MLKKKKISSINLKIYFTLMQLEIPIFITARDLISWQVS